MSAVVFNTALALGWLLVLVGGVWLSPGAGLVGAGLLLVALTMVSTWLCGGLYVPGAADGKGESA